MGVWGLWGGEGLKGDRGLTPEVSPVGSETKGIVSVWWMVRGGCVVWLYIDMDVESV